MKQQTPSAATRCLSMKQQTQSAATRRLSMKQQTPSAATSLRVDTNSSQTAVGKLLKNQKPLKCSPIFL